MWSETERNILEKSTHPPGLASRLDGSCRREELVSSGRAVRWRPAHRTLRNVVDKIVLAIIIIKLVLATTTRTHTRSRPSPSTSTRATVARHGVRVVFLPANHGQLEGVGGKANPQLCRDTTA